jgi:hypothetical protein
MHSGIRLRKRDFYHHNAPANIVITNKQRLFIGLPPGTICLTHGSLSEHIIISTIHLPFE